MPEYERDPDERELEDDLGGSEALTALLAAIHDAVHAPIGCDPEQAQAELQARAELFGREAGLIIRNQQRG